MTDQKTFQASDYADVFDISGEPSAAALVLSLFKEAADAGRIELLLQSALYAAQHDVLSREQLRQIIFYAGALIDLDEYPVETWTSILPYDFNEDYRTFEIRIDDSRKLRQGVSQLYGILPRALTTKKQLKEILKFFLNGIACTASLISASNYLRGPQMEDVLDLLGEPVFQSDLSDAVQDVIWGHEEFSRRFMDNMAVLLLLKRSWPQNYESLYAAAPRSVWKKLGWLDDTTPLDEAKYLGTLMIAVQQARIYGTNPDLALAMYSDDEKEISRHSPQEIWQATHDFNKMAWTVFAYDEHLDADSIQKGEEVFAAYDADPNLQFDVMNQLMMAMVIRNDMENYRLFCENDRLILGALSYLKAWEDGSELIQEMLKDGKPAESSVLPASAALLRAFSTGFTQNPDLKNWMLEQIEASENPIVIHARKAYQPGIHDLSIVENPVLEEEVLEALLAEIFSHPDRLRSARASFEEKFPDWKDLGAATRAMVEDWNQDHHDRLAFLAPVQLLAYFLSEDWQYWIPSALIYMGYEELLKDHLAYFLEAFLHDEDLLARVFKEHPELAGDPEIQQLIDWLNEDEDDEDDMDEDWLEDKDWLEDIANDQEAEFYRTASRDFGAILKERDQVFYEDNVFPLSFVNPDLENLLHDDMNDPEILRQMEVEEGLFRPKASENFKGAFTLAGLKDTQALRMWEARFALYGPDKLKDMVGMVWDSLSDISSLPYEANDLDTMAEIVTEAAGIMDMRLRMSSAWTPENRISAGMFKETLFRIAHAFNLRCVEADTYPTDTAAQKAAEAQDQALMLAELALNMWITRLIFENLAKHTRYETMNRKQMLKVFRDCRKFARNADPQTPAEIRKAVNRLNKLLNGPDAAENGLQDPDQLCIRKWETLSRCFREEYIDEDAGLLYLPNVANMIQFTGPMNLFEMMTVMALGNSLEGDENWRWAQGFHAVDSQSPYDEFVE